MVIPWIVTPVVKQWEQHERDESQDGTTMHMHIGGKINDTDRVPSNWKEMNTCRQCKQKLSINASFKSRHYE